LVLDEFSVDCGLDLDLCSGDSTLLQAVPSNGLGEVTWEWSILQEPTGAVYTFSGTSGISPTFSPVTNGEYIFQTQATDGLMRVATDEITVLVGDVTQSTLLMVENWHTSSQDPGWLTALDRISDGSVNVLDLVLQISDPLCL